MASNLFSEKELKEWQRAIDDYGELPSKGVCQALLNYARQTQPLEALLREVIGGTWFDDARRGARIEGDRRYFTDLEKRMEQALRNVEPHGAAPRES